MSRDYRATVWAVWGFSTVLMVAAAIQSLGNSAYSRETGPVYVQLVVGFAFSTVGRLIAGRTGNRIGWLFLVIGMSLALAVATDTYSFHGLVVDPGSRPLAATVAVAANVAFVPAGLALGMIFVLFPTGRPHSSRWRHVLHLSLASAALVVVGWTLRPGPINGSFNDYGVHIADPIGIQPLGPLLAIVFAVGVVGSVIGAVLGIASVVVRFRNAGPVERQQIKWLAGVGVVSIVFYLAGFVVNPIFGSSSIVANGTWLLFFATLTLGVPASTGVAIVRYRLYDIDRIISRTLSYATVTALLAGTFAIVVLVPTAVLGRGGHSPDWVIAAATLAVAALFRPVRTRVQTRVDHRFNRARYNAEQTVDAFTARLRDQTDIDALGAELLDVVRTTMQPTAVQLWRRA